MTRSDLIQRIAARHLGLPISDVEVASKIIFTEMIESLKKKQRIEIRGFGSFCLHLRKARLARNPKTGEKVALLDKYVPFFKPGKEMRERINSFA